MTLDNVEKDKPAREYPTATASTIVFTEILYT